MSEATVVRAGLASAASYYPLGPLNGAVPPAPAWFNAALQIEPERSVFDADGIPIELLTWGEIGKPGLLFLHGYASHADSWRFIAPFFSSDYRCAAISWSGMGKSGHRADNYYEFSTLGLQAVAAITHAQLAASGRRPIVIAQSLAGVISTIAALAHNPFEALIPIDTGFRHTEIPEADRKPVRMGHINRLYPDIASALARYRLSPDQDCENLYILDFLARLSLRQDGTGWRWRMDPKLTTDIRICWSPELLAKLPCKMAYLYGERSSLVAPRLAAITNILPAGTPVIGIPDADHNVLADQPIALIAALRAILAGWRE